jgi:hypothetical protein
VSDETPDRQVSEFAKTLATAVPHPGRLDRDALLFAAGRAARVRYERLWRASAALLFLLCVGLGATLVLRPQGAIERERVVYLPASAAPAAQPSTTVQDTSPPSPVVAWQGAGRAEGLHLRDRLLREGMAALPPCPLVWNGAAVQPLSERDVPEIAALRPAALSSLSGESTR